MPFLAALLNADFAGSHIIEMQRIYSVGLGRLLCMVSASAITFLGTYIPLCD
jgi:hypothetical protein